MDVENVLGETLALIGLPAWIVDDFGVVKFANSLTPRYCDQVRINSNGAIHISDSAAENALRKLMTSHEGAAGHSLPVNNRSGSVTNILHHFPIRNSSINVFPESLAVVTATSTAPPQIQAGLLRSMYGLTPAEAEVARRLARGSSVHDIALCNGTSANTVRSQLRNVLEKTGCRRQAELVALLSAISTLVPVGGGALQFGPTI